MDKNICSRLITILVLISRLFQFWPYFIGFSGFDTSDIILHITYNIFRFCRKQYTLLLRADKSLNISQSSIVTQPTPPSTLVYFLKAFCISFTMYHSIFINHSSIIIHQSLFSTIIHQS